MNLDTTMNRLAPADTGPVVLGSETSEPRNLCIVASDRNSSTWLHSSIYQVCAHSGKVLNVFTLQMSHLKNGHQILPKPIGLH